MLFKLPVYILLLATSYTSSYDECGKTDGITASGVLATPNRTIACDHLPYGTKLKIEDTIYVVEDKFGGGYTHKVDIFTDSKQKAFQFGKKVVIAEVIQDDYTTFKPFQLPGGVIKW